MKRFLPLLVFLAMVLNQTDAQQLPLFTQYRENISVINPAAIHSDYFIYERPARIGASYRVQWVGLENAPRTQIVQGDYIFTNGDGFGLTSGGYIMNDQTGPTGFTGVYGKIAGMLTDDPYYGGLSVGLTFGMVQYRVNGSEIQLRELNDVLSGRDQSQIFPDVGFGVYYYQLLEGPGFLDDSHVYGGISVPQVFGLSLEFQEDNGDYSIRRLQHYYASVGWLKQLRNDGLIEPSVWVRYVENTPVSIDFNLRYQTGSSMWLGAGVSTGRNLHFETGFFLGENLGFANNLKIGYGLDYAFHTFGPQAGTTHEINISYAFGE